MTTTEYINIFNLVRIPSFYDFVKYFKNINTKFSTQETETKINLNDYLIETENISQEIILILVFNIETSIEEIQKKEKILLKYLEINNMQNEIFSILEKEKNHI